MTRKPAALLAFDTTRNPDTFAPEQLARIAEPTELLRRQPVAEFDDPAIRSLLQPRVIELLTPFDFRIQVFDPFLAAAEAHALGVDIVELDTLMATSDLVSLHAPSTPATQGMIDRRRLALMRSGAILVNTARGALVDQDALIDETRSGRIDAIIDVTEPDVLPPDSPLYDIPNVFLTPHIAGSQGSETQRMTDIVLDELARYVGGEPLHHQVAFDALERLA